MQSGLVSALATFIKTSARLLPRHVPLTSRSTLPEDEWHFTPQTVSCRRIRKNSDYCPLVSQPHDFGARLDDKQGSRRRMGIGNWKSRGRRRPFHRLIRVLQEMLERLWCPKHRN